METEIKINDDTLTMRILETSKTDAEEDEKTVEHSDNNEEDVNDAISDDLVLENSGLIQILTDSELEEINENADEIDEDYVRRTPKRVTFGGEVIKMRTPDSDAVTQSDGDDIIDNTINSQDKLSFLTVDIPNDNTKPTMQTLKQTINGPKNLIQSPLKNISKSSSSFCITQPSSFQNSPSLKRKPQSADDHRTKSESPRSPFRRISISSVDALISPRQEHKEVEVLHNLQRSPSLSPRRYRRSSSAHQESKEPKIVHALNEILQFSSPDGKIFDENKSEAKSESIAAAKTNAKTSKMVKSWENLDIVDANVIRNLKSGKIAILVSFVVFRFRKQQKEKSGGPGGTSGLHSKQNGGSTLLGSGGLVSNSGDCVMSRGLHSNDSSVGYHADNGDLLRSVGGHHLVGPELISKKYKEREIGPGEHQRPQRPDIIEREVVSKSPPLREEHHAPIPPPTQSHHSHDHPNGVDLGSEFPEHYDLENASSIAPSDIDIVYHYKGYREAGGVRKYKATPPPVSSYTHHKHQASATQKQHRHSPHHAGPYAPRVPPQTSQPPPTNTSRQHQSTPLARLSPSSELSSQQPRILTLHDISGKPLQSALLATTSSSGGVGKDALHSNSERSLNSPVMSQLSGQSSSASRKNPGAPPQAPNVNTVGSGPMGLTAEEIERLNARPRTSSLVSTLDAVSSSSEAPRVPGPSHHLTHMHHSPDVDAHSSTSTDESGNDSFTCSEIEYDNTSINGDKYNKSGGEDDRRPHDSGTNSSKPPIPPPSYDGFDSSFRGSLSTLVASDDDLSTHMGGIYRQPNGASPSTTTLGWDYLLNWGPNFESLMGVFKDIAELPDSVSEHVSTSLRIPANVQKPSEEYV